MGRNSTIRSVGTGPQAVVLLHDGVVNSSVRDDVWASFCKRFHTIRYDRRGYGRSQETKSPYYEADDVAALLNSRKIAQPKEGHNSGHSFKTT